MKRLIALAFAVVLLLTPIGCCDRIQPKPAPTPTPTPPAPSSSVPPEATNPVIYEILGRSSKLTDKQWQAMVAWRRDVVTLAAKQPNIRINGSPDRKAVCLTFDDAPDPKITPQILDILAQRQVRASFFIVGKQIGDGLLVKRAYSDGHLVLSHGWSHRSLIHLDKATVDSEMKQTDDRLYELIDRRPALVRPPYGDIDATTAGRLSDLGDTAVLWSLDSLDWSLNDADAITANVLDNVRPGEIILLHSTKDREATAQALPRIITGLEKQGYSFIGLDEMLGTSAYR